MNRLEKYSHKLSQEKYYQELDIYLNHWEIIETIWMQIYLLIIILETALLIPLIIFMGLLLPLLFIYHFAYQSSMNQALEELIYSGSYLFHLAFLAYGYIPYLLDLLKIRRNRVLQEIDKQRKLRTYSSLSAKT